MIYIYCLVPDKEHLHKKKPKIKQTEKKKKKSLYRADRFLKRIAALVELNGVK